MTPETFITRWQHADGSELANAQSFVRELCELLDVPVPDPARARMSVNKRAGTAKFSSNPA